MLLRKLVVGNLLILTRTTLLGKNTVQHLHLDLKKKIMFKTVKKTAACSNSAVSHTTLKTLLQNCKSVDGQIDAFLAYMQLSEQDVSNRLLVCKDIERALKSVFPKSSLHPMGSSVSGVGLQGCDLDLSFHYPVTNDDTSRNIVVTNVDVSSGKVPLSDFDYLPLKQQLVFIQKVLKESGIIESSTVVPGRCPILNFSYNGIGCDLSTNNRLALQTTSLIQACSKLDQRVRPLFQLITYWGKHFKLIGGPVKFKSYAVFLMIVYFLQKRHPPILPKHILQSVSHKIELNEDVKSLSYGAYENSGAFTSSNSENLETLLREFFFFYANFDFTSVICTIDRSLWDGKLFLKKQPAFELNTINVQDPLNLSWNVTTGVDWKNSKYLIQSLLSACEAYHESSDQPTAGQNWGLLAIFDRPLSDYSFARKETVEIKFPLTNINSKYKCLNQICDLNNGEKSECLNEICDLNSIDGKSECLKQICNNVFNVLEDCLLFQCHPVDSKSIRTRIDKTALNNKAIAYHKKYDKFRTCENEKNGSAVDDDLGDVLFSHSMFVVASETWHGRGNFYRFQAENELDFRNTERQISGQVLNRKTEDEEKFIFLCKASVVSFKSAVYLNILMRNVNSTVFIPKLRIFLKEFFLKNSKFL